MKDTNIMFGLMKACHFELAKRPLAVSWMAGCGMKCRRYNFMKVEGSEWRAGTQKDG